MNDIETNARLLAVQVGRRLLEQGKMLALAESCTGGLTASLITDIAGSSAYFLGSAVTYSYEAKEQVLGVAHATLMAHGAVSPETAGEMARGARRLFGADLALAVTGIAGPGGATPEKPVGLVCIHLSAPDAEIDEQHVWPLDRIGNKLLSAQAVLALALRYLEGQTAAGVEASAGALGSREQPATASTPATSGGNLPDFPDEAVDVEVRLVGGRRVVPAAFTFKGARYIVLGVGREWQEEAGGAIWHCYLVQTQGPATFELRHDPLSGEWRVARAWGAGADA